MALPKHTKIYFDFFEVEFDPVSGWHNCVSEISGKPAVDINHIDCRGLIVASVIFIMYI